MVNTMDTIAEETLSQIKKAQTTGITDTTGLVSYDLTGVVSLIPVVTPLRDSIAREQSTDGAKFAIWRAIMDITNQQPNPFPGYGYAGDEVVFKEQDFQANYRPLALAGLATQDSLDIGKGLADTYAEATFQTLSQMLIAEDRALFGAQSFALPQVGTVTLTQGTGGTLGTATYYVACAARTGEGYYYGGNSRGRSQSTTFGSGSTNKITASVAAVKGAVAYDWFFSADNTTYYYVRTTTTTSTVITDAVAANQTPGGANLPDLSTWAPTLNTAADNGSAHANSFDGLFSTITADYSNAGAWTTSGGGNANPATWIDNGGAALTLSGGSVTEIQNLFQYIWNKIKASPTKLLMNATEAQKIANLVLGSISATTFLQTDAEGRVNATAGGRVGQVVNTAAGGVLVPIEVQVNMPPGAIIARTDRVPFPQSKISNVLAVRTLRDMAQFDYAVSRIGSTANGGPRKEFEIRSVEAFVNRAPVAFGSLVNIG